MSLMAFVFLILGGVLLTIGADLLVRGAARLAVALGLTPLVIGLTVVAFGTSAPEFAVSIGAAYNDQTDIALGNVVGSNIFNILLVLGLSALILPLPVGGQVIKTDLPFMIAVSIALLFVGWYGEMTVLMGSVSLALLAGYLLLLYFKGKRDTQAVLALDGELKEVIQAPSSGIYGVFLNSFLVIAGLALLVLGSHWFIDGAISIARWIGVSELVIGLTVVAAGTSLPEVATSVIAALKGEQDIAVGNLVGSNTFNLLGVLGVTAVLAPSGFPISAEAAMSSIPFMVAVAIFCFPVFFAWGRVTRADGFFFLLAYVGYTVYLVFDAKDLAVLDLYLRLVFFGFFPLVIVLAVSAVIHHVIFNGFHTYKYEPKKPTG